MLKTIALKIRYIMLYSKINIINDLILEIESLCINDEDITTYFNALPIIKKEDYLIKIVDESSLQEWITDVRNYKQKLSAKPLEKILNVNKLHNLIGYASWIPNHQTSK